MRKPTVSPAFAEPAYEGDFENRLLGGFSIRKVVTEHFPVKSGGDMTFGQLLDAQLEEAAMQGQEVQSVEVEMAPDHWKRFAAEVNGRLRP